MNHSAGTKLKPAAVLTGRASLTAADKAVDVKLKARFNEREEARTKTNLDISLENLGKHGFHEENKVGY